MFRALLISCLALLASLAAAQADYGIEVRCGVGGVVTAPYTRVSVQIARADTRPFVGRVVVETSGNMYRRSRGMRRQADEGAITISRDVSLAEGDMSGIVHLDVPVGNNFNVDVRLERQVTGEYYEAVAETQDSPAVASDRRRLVGFVTDARLKAAQRYLFFQAVEIPVADLPESWKPLAGFDAIVLNDDRVSRAQSQALVDYMTAGGTVIISPSSASSFNPETPAGSLLRVPPTSSTKSATLEEYADLLTGKLQASGFNNPVDESTKPPPPKGTRESKPEEVTVPEAKQIKLEQPPKDARLLVWTESGRAKPVAGTGGLVSIARVGAGNLVLLHTDISAPPFVTSENVPTTAAVKLLGLAVKPVSERSGRTPMRLLLDRDVRDVVDIAGNRIPGRDVLLILLLLYVVIAGVGMFIVARKIRRPELYPATLLVAAIISVGLVFGLGELFKRSGDRVKAVRVLVSDETTKHNAVFTIGCAYAMDGTDYHFVNSRKTAMMPARLNTNAGGLRGTPGGMPGDPQNFSTSFTSKDAETDVTELDRWQNVFFVERDPANLEDFSIEVTAMEGGIYQVKNNTSHELRACVLLVGGAAGPGAGSSKAAAACQWHYASRMAPAGGADSSLTFNNSTRIEDDVKILAERVADDTEDSELNALGALFSMDPEDSLMMAPNLQALETRLFDAGMLPGEGEFLLVAVLPGNALSGSRLGPQKDGKDIDRDDVGTVNLWMVRGGVEGR
jgi:hypothetical protein